MNFIRDERGFIKFLVIIAIFVLCIYAGYKFVVPYYKYTAFKSDVKEILRVYTGDVDRVKSQIYQKVDELNIPLDKESIKFKPVDKSLIVQASWSETVDLLGIYQHTLNFSIDLKS